MTADKSFLTSRKGFDNAIGISGNYTNTYGGTLSSVFKPFTTQFTVDGVPRYQYPNIESTHTSGDFRATSSGLNPYGPNTVFEGIISGTGLVGDLQASVPDPTSVRTFGLRNPMQVVGWGFDVFGMPTPNSSSGWNTSGTLSNFVPSGTFMGTGLSLASHGRFVPVNFYRAGPLDLRWDSNRGVWAGWDGGVKIGKVFSAHRNITGTPIAGSSYFPDEITYSVELFDGVANTMQMTGLTPYGPRPVADTYKIRPLSSGDPCFIIHITKSNGAPGYGIWVSEPPGVEACESIGGEGLQGFYGGAGDGDPADSTGILAGDTLFDGLGTFPLSTQYGGIGLTTVPENYVLTGNASGDVEARELLSGSGIDITPSGSTFTVSIGSGVAFIEGGVNTNITELQGLTTPLSIAQGGTGASSKNFVDLVTNQTLSSGVKDFYALRTRGGTPTNPGLSFRDDTTAGLMYHTGVLGVALVVSGVLQQILSTTGTLINNDVLISSTNSLDGTHFPPLRVRRSDNIHPSGDQYNIIQWEDQNGTPVGYTNISGTIGSKFIKLDDVTPHYPALDIRYSDATITGQYISIQQSGVEYFSALSNGSGFTLGPPGNRISLIKPENTSDFTLILPTGSTSTLNLATKQYVDNAAPQATGYTGTLNLLDANGTTTHELTISNGKIMSVVTT